MKPPDFTLSDCVEYCSIHGENTSPARVELAALRATIAEQARRLEDMRRERDMAVIACRAVIDDLWKDMHLDVIEMVMSVVKSDDARTNAPAPQEQPETIVPNTAA